MKKNAKRNILSLVAAALTLVLMIGLAAPMEASAATNTNHNGMTFTITGEQFMDRFFEALGDAGLEYSAHYEPELSDANCQFYPMYDGNGKYTMEVVIYTDYITGKIETIRMDFTLNGCTEAQMYDNIDAMLVAYEVANVKMNDTKWNNMLSTDTLVEIYDGYGFFGQFDGVEYQLSLTSEYVEMMID